MANSQKVLRAAVERLERGSAVLDVDGKEVTFPRASLPTPLEVGDVLSLTIVVDDTVAARDFVASKLDDMTGKRVGSRKRGNPRATPTRAMKK
jgi:hypothetical protein